MREFDLVIEHTAGKENLLADALSRKHKYSFNPTEEQDFIPQSINPTEDNSTLQDTFITTNNLSISPIPQEITMVSRGCINFKHTDCDYNKCAGRGESLGHNPSCPYLEDENDGDYEDYDDIKEAEMQSDEDTLSTIPEEIFDGTPADDSPFITNDHNIPAIITDVVHNAWEHYKQHRKHHNTDCHDYYCRSHRSSHQNGNPYCATTRYSVCGTYGHGCLDCTLAEAVYQKEKEFQSSQRDSGKLKATTIPPNNTPSSETPDYDIPELNIKEAPNRTYMWSAEEWAIRNAPIACHEPWGQQHAQNNPWDCNTKIVPDEERCPFLSAAVTTRSQRNAASGEPSGSNQGHNTLLSPTNPMRYVPGVGFMHQQHHISNEENNHVLDPQPQEKTSIPPAPTATRRYNFCKGEAHYASTCEAKREADSDLRYRIVPITNMAKIYLDLNDCPKDDPDFYLVAHVDKDDRMRDPYIACIRICPMWSQLYNAPEGKKGVSKDNGFLYKTNEKVERRLVLPSTFDMNGKNYLEDAIKEAHDATAYGGVEKTLKWLTDKFICQPFSRLVKECVASCNTCQQTKYSNKPPLGQVTMLHVSARAWADITMDFLKMSPVFTYCSALYPNIPLEDDQMICFSRLWTIVCSQSGFMYLIPGSDNLMAEMCTDTFDKHVASVLGNPYYIIFYRGSLFMSGHFKD